MHKVCSLILSLEPYNSPETCKEIIIPTLGIRKLRPRELTQQVAHDSTTRKSQGCSWNPGLCSPVLTSFR